MEGFLSKGRQTKSVINLGTFTNLNKTIGYFDITSLDLETSKWKNLIISHNDINLTGGSFEDNALLLTNNQYGSIITYEPIVTYIIFKTKNLSEVTTYAPIFTKKLTESKGTYGFDTYISPNKHILFSGVGVDIESSISPSDYHCVCCARISNSKAELYIDGVLIGVTNNIIYTGNYTGEYRLNRCERGSNIADKPVSVYYKMLIICNEYHDKAIIEKNSEYLLSSI